MEVMKSSVTYFVRGKDDTGLIPKGTGSVIVDYDNSNGAVKSVFYLPIENGVGSESETTRLNTLAPKTAEEVRAVVSFLESSVK